MSEQNKALTKRFYEEVMNKKNLGAIDELCAPNVIDHFPMPGQGPGAQGMKEALGQFLRGFPDLHVTIEEIVAERDIVVVRARMEGTHNGELMGAAPTGKKVTCHANDMIRVKDGKAVEVWHQGDEVMAMMQLGVKPPTA